MYQEFGFAGHFLTQISTMATCAVHMQPHHFRGRENSLGLASKKAFDAHQDLRRRQSKAARNAQHQRQ